MRITLSVIVVGMSLSTVSRLDAQVPQILEVSDGARIAYRVSGDGPPVVFLHGFLSSMDLWSAITEPLESEFTIVLFDLRGHGLSTNPPPIFDHSRFADDVIEVMDHLGFEQFGAVGHSAGGIGVLHLATAHPERVSWQVVIAGSPKLDLNVRESLSMYPAFEELDPTWRAYLEETHPRGRAQIDQLLAGMRDYARDRADIDFDAQTLGKITGPTLVVWGDRDPFGPLELALRLFREIPDASLWVLPGMGHLPFWPGFGGTEDAAAELTNRLRSFRDAR